MQGQRERTSEAILESEARLRELDARLASDAEVEYGQVSSELMQVRESLTKLQDRVDRLVVRAPVAGRLKDLKVRRPGAVIPPGMVVAEIVPQDQRLKVEARLSPRDVGHVRPGQQVAVKVESFAFSTYGAITGRLERIAASTTTDPDGALYYKAVIALDQDYVGSNPDRNMLQSGMTCRPHRDRRTLDPAAPHRAGARRTGERPARTLSGRSFAPERMRGLGSISPCVEERV